MNLPCWVDRWAAVLVNTSVIIIWQPVRWPPYWASWPVVDEVPTHPTLHPAAAAEQLHPANHLYMKQSFPSVLETQVRV